MARSYRPVSRDQPFLLPVDMREWLPGDHLVWFLLDTLEELDLSVFHAGHRRGGAGRAAYDPDMMVALLIYAYCCGQRSSRAIERSCHVNVAFRVVCAGDVPDHTKIARFRQVHQEAFAGVFAQVLAVAAKAGLGRFETVAIDGTKIAANASMQANREADWFAREEITKIIAEANAADAAEDLEHGPDDRGDGTPPQVRAELRDPTRRRARIAAAAAQIEAGKAAAAQRRAPSPEQAAACAERLQLIAAGGRPRGGHGTRLTRLAEAKARLERDTAAAQARLDAYAAAVAAGKRPRGGQPVAVEDTYRVVRARASVARAAAVAAVPTTRQAPRRTELTANITDADSRLMPTRKGFLQGFNAQLAVTADQVIAAVSLGQNPVDTEQFQPMMAAAMAAAKGLHALTGRDQHTIGIILADAGYPSPGNFTAPGPDRLIALGKSRDQATAAKTRPTHGDPPPGATPREVMDHRLRTPEGARLYKRRGATVEPGIGNLKKLLPRFSRRGLSAALSELHLAAAAFNLRKIHTAALTA